MNGWIGTCHPKGPREVMLGRGMNPTPLVPNEVIEGGIP
jgi:hypothetical protein